jgi:hypothetical protein
MALMAGACITAGAAFYIARDDGPPREGTRAEVSTFPSPTAPALSDARSPPATANLAIVGHNGIPALDLAELEHRLAGLDRESRDLLLREELPALVASDPAAIARYAELQTDAPLREQLVRQVAQLWAKSDADRAMAWITSLPESPEREATLIDVTLAVAETDAPKAAALREATVGNIEPDGVLEAIAQRWAERDFDSALAWVDSRPRNLQQGKLLQRLAYVRAAAGSPEEAARMVEESFDSGPLKVEAADIVADQWSRTDPAAASDWLAGLKSR